MNKTLTPLVGTGIVVVLDDVLNKGRAPAPTTFIGLGFVGVVLSLIDESAPQVAIPLAWLVFLSVLLTRGVSLFRKVF